MQRRASILALLSLAACQFSLDRTVSPGQLRGKLVFAAQGGVELPAADALVVLEDSSITLNADSTGTFVISGLLPGTYALTITASQNGSATPNSGIRLQGLPLTDLGGGKANGLDLGTIVLGSFGSIQGTATVDGVPAVDATAVLTGISEVSVSPTGFLFTLVPPGDYQLTVAAPSGGSAAVSTPLAVHVNPLVTTNVGAIALTTSSQTGNLAGAVRLLDLVGQAQVVVAPGGEGGSGLPPVMANSDGLYQFVEIPPGIYTVTASQEGYVSVTVSFLVVAGGTTTVPTITLSPGVTSIVDAGQPDAGTVDAGPIDAGPVDAGPVDAGNVDVPAKLVFQTQPSDSTAGATFDPVVTVAIEDADGNVITTSTDEVSLAVSSGALVGETAQGAIGGVASFSGLDMTLAGTNFTLTATATGLTSATSTSFTISPGNASALAFTVQPSDVIVGEAIAPPIQVSVEDAYGNVVPTAISYVNLTGQGPRSESLGGSPGGAAVGGVAVFPDVNVTFPGSVTIVAASDGLISTTSLPFTVTAGADAGTVDAGPMAPALPDGGIWVTTLSGNGFAGVQDGTGGPTGSGQFYNPSLIAVDADGGTFEVDWDTDSDTSVLRTIDLSGNVTTLVPALQPTSGVAIQSPNALVVDPAGNIYIAGDNDCVWLITPVNFQLSAFAGQCQTETIVPTAGNTVAISGLAFDAQGDLFMSDSGAGVVWEVMPGDDGWNMTSFAYGSMLSSPSSVAVDTVNDVIYISDTGTQSIFAADSGGNLTLVAGPGPAHDGESFSGLADGTGGADGTANLSYPTSLAYDGAGHLYFLDDEDAMQSGGPGPSPIVPHRPHLRGKVPPRKGPNGESSLMAVRRIDLTATPVAVATLTNPERQGYLDGPAGPEGTALVDAQALAVSLSGNLLIADGTTNRVRSMAIAPGAVGLTGIPTQQSPIATGALTVSTAFTANGPSIGLAVDSKFDVYLGETTGGTTSRLIEELPNVPNDVSAGYRESILLGGDSAPGIVYGLAVSSSGTLYYSLPGSSAINSVSADGATGTVPGTVTSPWGLAVDSSNSLYVADTGGNVIREISGESVITLAGTGSPGWVDGPAATAEFFHPSGIAVDTSGDVFVIDDGNNTVREISGGIVTTVVGNGQPGTTDGTGGRFGAAQLNYPTGIAVDAAGHLFIADAWSDTLRMYDPGTNTLGTIWSASNSLVTSVGMSGPTPLYAVAVDKAGNIYLGPQANGPDFLEVEQLTCGGSWCGTTCVNENIDPNNCNTCGNVCGTGTNQAASCVARKCELITTVASGQGVGEPEQSLLLASGQLIWSDAVSASILSVSASTSGGTPTSVQSSYPLAIATDGTNLYFADSSGDIIQGGSTPITLTSEPDQNGVYALASDGAQVYWTDAAGYIQSIPIGAAAGATTTVASNRTNFGAGESGYELRVDTTNVYWEEGANGPVGGQFLAVAKGGGGTVQTLASDSLIGNATAFDINGSSVFWIDSAGVMSAPLAGGGTVSTLATATYSPYGLAADDTNLYFTAYDDTLTINSVIEVPVGGGTPVTLAAGTVDMGVFSPTLIVAGPGTIYWTDFSEDDVTEVLSTPKVTIP